jgi:hypothetical protein
MQLLIMQYFLYFPLISSLFIVVYSSTLDSGGFLPRPSQIIQTRECYDSITNEYSRIMP